MRNANLPPLPHLAPPCPPLPPSPFPVGSTAAIRSRAPEAAPTRASPHPALALGMRVDLHSVSANRVALACIRMSRVSRVDRVYRVYACASFGLAFLPWDLQLSGTLASASEQICQESFEERVYRGLVHVRLQCLVGKGCVSASVSTVFGRDPMG